MTSTSTTARTLPSLLPQDLTLPAGETINFTVDGSVVTLHGTGSGVAVLSSRGNAVVMRPHTDDRFVVTGAAAHHSPSEPLAREDAISLAVMRLER